MAYHAAFTVRVCEEHEVGPGRYCPPRLPTHLGLSFTESYGILSRGEKHLIGPSTRGCTR
jgi:hypothetical protein